MRKSSQELLDSFQVRKSNNEKRSFINWLTQYLNKQGYELKEEKYHKEGINLIVGDLKQADIILTAHYDTQPHSIFPMFMGFSNWLSFLISQLWVMLPIGAIAFFCGKHLTLGIVNLSIKEIGLGASGGFLLCLYTFQITKGFANTHTANDNTSGVATLLAILEDLPDKDREKVCFVFFDQEELGLLGSQHFKQHYHDIISEKPLINFDCVGDGNTLFFVTKKKFRATKFNHILDQSVSTVVAKTDKSYRFGTSFKHIYTSDQIIFKNSVGVAAAKKLPVFGYYLNRIHTGRDTKLDHKNIEYLSQALVNFISCI